MPIESTWEKKDPDNTHSLLQKEKNAPIFNNNIFQRILFWATKYVNKLYYK